MSKEQFIELDANEVRGHWDNPGTVTGLVFIAPTREQYEANDCQDTVQVDISIGKHGEMIFAPRSPYQDFQVNVSS